MAIDRVTVNIYTCSKCQYKWLSGWDNENNKEHPFPSYCPKCKNFRWDWDLTPEEKELFGAVLNKHVSKTKSKQGIIYLDIIAIDFLYRIRPQPDMFELKQVLSIPTTEKRHEAMLTIMEDRARNYDKYPTEQEGRLFPKYTSKHKAYEHWIWKSGTEQVFMKGCKHEQISRAVRQQLKERGFTLMGDRSTAEAAP